MVQANPQPAVGVQSNPVLAGGVQPNPEQEGGANPEKPTVMVLGSIGHGKSTFMNKLGGQEMKFKSGRSIKGVTQDCVCYEFENFNLIDTPGLNDARIPTVDWVQRFNTNEHVKPQPLALCIMLFKSSARPAIGDINVLGICKNAISNLSPRNCVLIFTHCDEDM